ncbi:MAG: YfhO family protein, partial [Endomicrobium sp.]|nr:YfhO family protein [Endomicrobium sp.]
QAAVLEEKLDSNFMLLNEPIFREVPIQFQAKATPNISVYGNVYTIAQQSGVISFNFKGLPNSETYLAIKNIKLLTPYNPEEYLYIRAPRTIKSVPLLGVWSPWYIDRSDFIINTGFNTEEINELLLAFNPNSRFSIDNIEIISLPIGAEFDAEIERLKQDYLQSVQILPNKIKGNINLSSNKILLLSVPYTKGWKAFVNGRETKLLRANTRFSALPLKAGSYDIELRYRTPGILLGLALSCAGFLLFAALLYLDKRKNKICLL